MNGLLFFLIGFQYSCNHADESLYPYFTTQLLQEEKVVSISGTRKIDNENDTDSVFNFLPTYKFLR